MTNRKTTVLLGILGALIGVSAPLWYWSHASRHVLALQPGPSADEAFTREDRLDIMEAVYRRMCHPFVPAPAAGGIPQPGAVWFFAVGPSNDPPTELLQRLSDLPSSVKPLSSAVQKDTSLVDRETGQPGAVFLIRGAQMTTTNEAQVDARTQPLGGSNQSERVYTVNRADDKWQVTQEKSK